MQILAETASGESRSRLDYELVLQLRPLVPASAAAAKPEEKACRYALAAFRL